MQQQCQTKPVPVLAARWRPLGGTAVGAVTLVLTLLHLGCATVSLGEPQVQSRKVISSTKDVEVTRKVAVDLHQDGVVATVRAFHICGDRTTEQLEVTTRRERLNDSAALDWTLGIAGLTTAGVGIGLSIDSTNVYPDDRSSREYNPYGRDLALGIGVGVTVVGAALLAIPVVDVVRAQGEISETHHEEERSELANVRTCKDRPYAGLPVMLGTQSVGATGADGSLQVDLPDHFEESLFSESKVQDPKVTVRVQNEGVGSVSLTPVAEHYERLARERERERDEAVWQDADEEACRSPEGVNACDGVERYLETLPNGSHVVEARELLEAAQPKLAELRDDAKWEAIESESVAGCVKPESEDACDPVKRYLDDYPDGRHAKEAKAVLKKAAPALAALRRQRERREKAERAMRSIIEVENVRLEFRDPLDGWPGQVYVVVHFDATFKRAVSRQTEIDVRIACMVAGRRMVDTSSVMELLDAYQPGDTKRFDVPAFVGHPLKTTPTTCRMRFSLGAMLSRQRRPLGSFCYGVCE